jgi:CRP/FNR family transcriptional regulator, cyclic AMP receptor protein
MTESTIHQKIAIFSQPYPEYGYDANSIIVPAGNQPPGILYLTEGIVKQSALFAKGESYTINIFKPYSFFPMTWALHQEANLFQFEALTACRLKIIPPKHVIAFLKQEPSVVFDLLTRVLIGADGLIIRTTQLLNNKATDKLVITLVILARRFGKKVDTDPKIMIIDLPLNESELAAQAGLSRETVSRELGELKKQNLISYSHPELTILDFPQLEKLSQNLT